jgi:putative sugar O-methyltransferase
MALNASLQIKKALTNSQNKTILEIGSGSGATPYWCHRLGLGPIQIIDLPHVAVLQAFYLLKSLPNANILLYGEKLGLNQPDITIYPHWANLELPRNKVELVFNQDSFAEMSNEVVLNYLTWIRKIDARYLLSINHESGATYDTALTNQINVSRLIQKDSAFVSLSRHPNWVRQGYVEQLWELK